MIESVIRVRETAPHLYTITLPDGREMYDADGAIVSYWLRHSSAATKLVVSYDIGAKSDVIYRRDFRGWSKEGGGEPPPFVIP
jgi:hypothetical protein